MDYNQYNLEELQDMFDNKQNPEELNTIMSVIVDKEEILSNDYKETNNIQLEEEIYPQMNLFKLKDLKFLPLEEIKRKLYKKFKKMVVDEKNNNIGENLNICEIESNIVNNIIPKPKNMVNLLEGISIS